MEQIFDIWPTYAEMARDVSVPLGRDLSEVTVRSWKRRGMIPSKYDRAIAQAAARRGRDLSLAKIAEVRAAVFDAGSENAA